MITLACSGCSEDEQQPARCVDFEGTTQLPDIPLAYSTDHLDIHVDNGRLLCAGSVREYESFYQYVGDTLGAGLSQRIPVFIVEHIDEFCPRTTSGCLFQDGVIFATPGIVYHELAHAASCDWRSVSAPVLGEGLAVSFEVSPLAAKSDPMGFIASRDAWELDYAGAGHFVRWLLETSGPELLREAYATAPHTGGERVVDILESIYARDIDALLADYQASAPYMWIPHRQCADLELLEPAAGTWTFSAVFDCDDPATLGPYERNGNSSSMSEADETSMFQSFLIEVESPGSYRFEREPGTGVYIERCIGELGLGEVQAAKLWYRDAPFSKLQERADVELSPGIYRVDVLRQYAEPHPVWLRISPSPD